MSTHGVISALPVASTEGPTAAVQPPAMPTKTANGTPSLPITRTEDLTLLTSHIASNVQTYLSSLDARGFSPPTLKNAIPEPVKDDAALAARVEIMRACEKLMALIQGPVEWLMFQNMAFTDPACVGLAIEMGLHEIIKEGEEPTSLDELVEKSGAERELVERVMRVCTQRLCFEEVAPEQYKHNGVSLGLLLPTLGSLIHHCCEDGLLSAAHLLPTLRENKFKIPDDPAKSAFSKAFNTHLGMFDYFYTADPNRGSRFALGMAGTEAVKSLTEDIFPFHSLRAGSTIVDVGGGRGQVSVRIAEKESQLKFIVQDAEAVIEGAVAEGLGEGLEGRVEWVGGDFFEEVRVKGKEVYLLRFVLHDWPDTACIKILRNVVAAMGPGSRILIDDAVVPDLLGTESLRFFNMLDMYMMMILNAKERTERQWVGLLGEVDERLVVHKIWREEEGGLQGGTVLEVRLRE